MMAVNTRGMADIPILLCAQLAGFGLDVSDSGDMLLPQHSQPLLQPLLDL